MPHAQRIASFLLNIGAVKLSPNAPFTWTSGIRSPIYCDNRMIYSHIDARKLVVDALASRVNSLHVPPDVIAGTATAAIGWAAMVAQKLDLPFVYVRSKPKEHGAKKRIEGDLPKGKHIVLLEDLLSTGGSALSSVEALREECEAVVTDVVAIFSYEFPDAKDSARVQKVMLHPLCTINTLLDVAIEDGRIEASEKRLVEAFIKNPKDWEKR